MYTTAIGERRRRTRGFMAALGLVAGLLVAVPARAQDAKDAPESEAKDDSTKKDDSARKDSAGDLLEDPLERYYFLGVRFRDIVLPQFMLELFAAGGATGNLWLVGPELSTRKNNIEIDVALAYADYAFGPAMFRGKNEDDVAYEVVKSDMKVGYLTFDLLYDVPLDKSGMFSFLVGGGVGIGVVGGDLYRTQAYPKGGAPDPSDPNKWEKCRLEGDGGANAAYCDASNDHFYKNGKDYAEKSWIDGGSKPVVVPWISLPQFSLRVKPIKHLQARLDIGFAATGFFTGLSAGYGF